MSRHVCCQINCSNPDSTFRIPKERIVEFAVLLGLTSWLKLNKRVKYGDQIAETVCTLAQWECKLFCRDHLHPFDLVDGRLREGAKPIHHRMHYESQITCPRAVTLLSSPNPQSFVQANRSPLNASASVVHGLPTLKRRSTETSAKAAAPPFHAKEDDPEGMADEHLAQPNIRPSEPRFLDYELGKRDAKMRGRIAMLSGVPFEFITRLEETTNGMEEEFTESLPSKYANEPRSKSPFKASPNEKVQIV